MAKTPCRTPSAGNGHVELPDRVEHAILILRGHKVLLDADLAALYRVETKALNQAMRRNRERFPEDFAFQLTQDEARRSRSQIVTLNAQIGEITEVQAGGRRKRARGANLKYLPYAFTEQGVAMLSTVLRSPRAIAVNIEIMRAFVRLRRILATNHKLAERLEALEQEVDAKFRVVFDAIRELMTPPVGEQRRIGFRQNE